MRNSFSYTCHRAELHVQRGYINVHQVQNPEYLFEGNVPLNNFTHANADTMTNDPRGCCFRAVSGTAF